MAELADEGYVEPVRPFRRDLGKLWTLVRNKQGLAGWALQGRLIAAIPDEVAQYSEGARITSILRSRRPMRTVSTNTGSGQRSRRPMPL